MDKHPWWTAARLSQEMLLFSDVAVDLPWGGGQLLAPTQKGVMLYRDVMLENTATWCQWVRTAPLCHQGAPCGGLFSQLLKSPACPVLSAAAPQIPWRQTSTYTAPPLDGSLCFAEVHTV